MKFIETKKAIEDELNKKKEEINRLISSKKISFIRQVDEHRSKIKGFSHGFGKVCSTNL